MAPVPSKWAFGIASRTRIAALCEAILAAAFCASALAQPAIKPLPTLTRVDQVRRLTPDQASLQYPVRIRGVITMDAPAPDFFIQDASAGIFAEGSVSSRYSHVLGELVEVEGVTGPGKFAPTIREIKLRVLGKGRLPKAPLLAFAQLADGQEDSQWVQVRGIVRSVDVDKKSWQEPTAAIHIASEGSDFYARVPISEEQDFSSWIGSQVLVEGVCGSLYNASRQLTGILFYVPRLSFIKVEGAAPEVPISALLRFSPGTEQRHRVRIRGVVGYQEPGNALYLQSEGRGLRVLTKQTTPLRIGDVVDVLGFPGTGESAPMLYDGVFYQVGHSPPPEPVQLNLDALWEEFDGALVSIRAKLLGSQTRPDGLRLLLQTGDVLFDATLPPGVPTDQLSSTPPNSQVQASGICLVRSGGLWRVPESFRLLLRSPRDITLISAPSWWNLRHTLWLLAITVGILLVVVAWVVVLGRRVREQMAVIRQKLQHSAVLEERNRIARELHDNLEQELAGITMQLDLAADCFQQAPGTAQRALSTARDMTRHSMVEARRSVWDLRCQLLEQGNLISAFSQIVEPLTSPDHAAIEIKIQGSPTRLAGHMEMNLLRIGQEAVANAVKHGSAQHVMIELTYSPQAVCLSITDDGSGFIANQGSSTGHFGLLDMRERAQSMGSDLVIKSQPGNGTRVSVQVALEATASEARAS